MGLPVEARRTTGGKRIGIRHLGSRHPPREDRPVRKPVERDEGVGVLDGQAVYLNPIANHLVHEV